MNLLEVKNILRGNIEGLYVDSAYRSNNDDAPYLITNIRKLKTTLDNLEAIPFIQPELDLLKKSWFYKASPHIDAVAVSSTDDSFLKRVIATIRTGLSYLDRVIQDKELATTEDVIHIKLPDLKTFDELSKVANELKRALELPILDETIDGSVNILSADSGSIWLDVAVGTISAVNLIGGLFWAAAVIRKKQAEAKIFEEHARTLELKNDSLSIIRDAQKQQIDNILTNEAEAIATKHYNRQDPETIERLKLSISTFADLIERGTQILPASTSEKITENFPPSTYQEMIVSAIKELKQ